MVVGVGAPPEIVGRQRQDADDAADPIIGETMGKERPVAAIVLDHEETHEEAGSRHGEQQAYPIAGVHSGPHQNPDEGERHRRDRELEHAARGTRLAVAGEHLCQRAGIGRRMNVRRPFIHAAPNKAATCRVMVHESVGPHA